MERNGCMGDKWKGGRMDGLMEKWKGGWVDYLLARESSRAH